MLTAMASALLAPNAHCAILTPSGLHKIVKATPDTTISLGKYGSFPVNLILGRPFHYTFEILDKAEGASHSELRIVPPAELHAEALAHGELSETPQDGAVKASEADQDPDAIDIVGEDGQYIVRNNRLTIDDPSRQALKWNEIEELKKSVNTGSGRDIIAKIMASHQALDEKTEFSLAKYTLRKSRKYLKRFTLLPLDVSMLGQWMIHEKDSARILEIREESLGLIQSWANVHGGLEEASLPDTVGQGRWLVVDEAGGFIVAAMAERMGLLHREEEVDDKDNIHDPNNTATENDATTNGADADADADDVNMTDGPVPESAPSKQPGRKSKRPPPEAGSATSNTITVVHSAHQPNLSVLSYFDYDPNMPSDHPLHAHLKTLSWLQLLQPTATPSYTEQPAVLPEAEIAALKASKRGIYHRKQRRFARTVRTINETRAGAFDGLVIATVMEPIEVLHHLVPLVKGGGQVVVYSPTAPSLVDVMDAYSTARKSAFLQAQAETETGGLVLPSEDFPLDPRLLLAPALQSARAKEWQVLPGRTHPMMTGRGGPEGYVFTGTRVIPLEGAIARGSFNKKRKKDDGSLGSAKNVKVEERVDEVADGEEV